MANQKLTALILLFIFSFSSAIAAERKAKESAESLLEDSQSQFYKNDLDGALSSLQKYFGKVLEKSKKARGKLRFLAIAAMGRIYLQYKQDPAGAITWFEKVKKSHSLTDAEGDIIEGWIAAAKEWQKLGKFPSAIKTEKEMFELGKQYYDSGLKKSKSVVDQAGTVDFSIAASYLVPFLVHYDKSPNVGEALFMMGDVRRRLWGSNEHWSENYYLTEAIRRFPNTPLAIKSYEALNEDVRFGYTGSSGDHTPQSWVDLLSVFRKIAKGEEPATSASPRPKSPDESGNKALQ